MYIKSFLLTSQSSNPISAQQDLSLLWTNRRKGPNVCELSCTYGGQSVQVEALIKDIGGCVTHLSTLLRSNQIWQHLSSISETKGEARQAHNGTNVLATGAAWTLHRAYLQPCLSAKKRIYRKKYHHSGACPPLKKKKKTFLNTHGLKTTENIPYSGKGCVLLRLLIPSYNANTTVFVPIYTRPMNSD